MRKNWFFILLLSIAALSLAGTAAYFSVFGISKLFMAAGMGIIILASSLEFSKLVTVSYVYRFWKSIKKTIRWFYVFAVVFIMLLTSIGIYGFLTSAYQKSANKIEIRDSQIKIANNKKTLFVNQLDRINKTIESDNNRITQLSNIRGLQERRIDTLYKRKQVSNARRTETSISGADEQIKFLNSDITDKMKQANSVNDSVAYYDQKIVEYKSSDVSNEVGPYKFVADLTGISMNRVVNIVAILIILVFDPLAIALLIGVNQLTMIDKKEEDEEEKKEHKPLLKRIRSIIKRTPKVEKEEIPKVEKEEIPKVEIEKSVLKEEEPVKEVKIVKKETVEQKLPLNFDEEEIEDKPEIEKKTLVGEDYSENITENETEEDFEEEIIPLDTNNLSVGQIVSHDIFGKGKILEVYPNQKAKIAFFNLGVKELNTEFANLKEIKRKKVDKDWFDEYTEIIAETEPKKKDDIYVREKEINGATLLELTTNEVEHDEEIPYVEMKIGDIPIEPEQIESKPEPIIESQPQPIIVEQIIEPPVILPEIPIEKKSDDGIQSITFDTRVIDNNYRSGPRIRFTKDRRGKI